MLQVKPSKPAPPQRPGQPGGKRDLNRRRQTVAIADAALALFNEHGVDRVAIGDITREAGVAKGSFYRYFKDKEAVVAALIQPLVDPVFAAMDRCAEALEAAETLEALTLAFQALAADLLPPLLANAGVGRLYLQEARSPHSGARAPIRRAADAVAAKGLALTEIAHRVGVMQTIHPAVSSLAVIGAVERLLFAFLNGHDLGPTEALPGAMVTLIMNGLSA